MAFGGALVSHVAGLAADGDFANYMELDGLTLGVYAGAPNVANADTGLLTTAAAGGSVIPNTITFGKGRGNWVAGDEYRVICTVNDDNAVQQVALTGDTSLPHVVATYPLVNAGNLEILVHNRGNAATGSLRFTLEFVPTRE